MRLFFEDPKGRRLALDTDRREWAADYANDKTEIRSDHSFIKVSEPEDLETIEREADFCAWSYGDTWTNHGRGAGFSVYSEYLRELTQYSERVDAGKTYKNEAAYIRALSERVKAADEEGYFTPLQREILAKICEDLEESITLYGKNQDGNGTDPEEGPEPIPF